MKSVVYLVSLISFSAATAAADKDLRVSWADKVVIASEDGTIQFEIGGRIHNDWAFMGSNLAVQDAFGNLEDGVEFRRARVLIGGELYRHTEFRIQYDFATGEAEARDVYLGFKEIPVLGGIRVGQFKEPFSLEELISSNDIPFIERSLMHAFAPSRQTGIMLYNSGAGDALNWAGGVFRETDDAGTGTGDNNYSLTGRISGSPWYADEGRRLLHLGFATSYRSLDDQIVRFSTRPEAHLAPTFLDTGLIGADSYQLQGLEGAVQVDSFSLQSELSRASVDRLTGSDASFHGFYLEGSFVLTGEHRSYRRSSGVFGTVRPRNNFMNGSGGLGAWETKIRFSRLDLDDQEIAGGILEDITLGLNWYLNPNVRIMWNYVHADLESVGDADIFQMRFQVNF